MAAMLFGIGVTILGVGFIWFYIVRPILEDYNVIGPRVMSYDAADPYPDQAVVHPVDQRLSEVGQRIAMPDNEDNAPLPDNPVLPEEVRDIIRFQAKAEALAALIRDGQVGNMAKGIERVFQCSRSSKESSTYQQARRALAPLLPSGPQFLDEDGQRVAASYPVTGQT